MTMTIEVNLAIAPPAVGAWLRDAGGNQTFTDARAQALGKMAFNAKPMLR